MAAEAVEPRKYELLPTGKPHTSFSEVGDWNACSYRHKLKYVDKVGENLPGVHADFGTAIHATVEHFIKTRTIDKKLFLKELHELWTEHEKLVPKEYTAESFKQFAKEGLSILGDIPAYFDAQFPGWEAIDAEHALYEPLGELPHAFKGYIDCIIKVTDTKGKTLIWILDAKTCGWGWAREKKEDPMVRAQIILYKTFWANKTQTDPKDVRCAFLLLKRTAKPGSHCELVVTSVGPVSSGRALAVVNNMVSSVKRGVAIKNRNSCTFCNYKDTQWCT